MKRPGGADERRPQSPEKHAQTKEVVDSFLKNEGPELHERLKEYASTRASYIEEWWTESCVLGAPLASQYVGADALGGKPGTSPIKNRSCSR